MCAQQDVRALMRTEGHAPLGHAEGRRTSQEHASSETHVRRDAHASGIVFDLGHARPETHVRHTRAHEINFRPAMHIATLSPLIIMWDLLSNYGEFGRENIGVVTFQKQ